MLNRKKVTKNLVKFRSENNCNRIAFNNAFLEVPGLSKNTYIQTNLYKNVDLGFLTVFGESNEKLYKTGWDSTRFEYNSKQFKKFYIYQIFKKKSSNKFTFDLKSFFVFLHKVFKRKKKLPYYLLKQIKGGFMTSSLGAVCFTPRSLYKNSNKLQIINLKIFQKNTKKFTRPLVKINLVSSLKNRKRKN